MSSSAVDSQLSLDLTGFLDDILGWSDLDISFEVSAKAIEIEAEGGVTIELSGSHLNLNAMTGAFDTASISLEGGATVTVSGLDMGVKSALTALTDKLDGAFDVSDYLASNALKGGEISIDGDAHGNLLSGLGLADVKISAHAGADSIDAGLGARLEIDGGSGFDIVGYASAKTGVVASLLDSLDNGGAAKGDSFISVEGLVGTRFSDLLAGDAKANLLVGDGGIDKLIGGLGADSLIGGLGKDVLWGDQPGGKVGADVFIFESLKDRGDTIMDFDAKDTIGIDASSFGLSDHFEFSADTFVSGVKPIATSAEATFLFDTKTGALSFDADGNGAGKSIFIADIHFDGHAQLSASDFELI